MPSTQLIAALQKHKNEFQRVIDVDPSSDRIVRIDLSEENDGLSETNFSDYSVFSGWINEKLNAAQARYGVGGYAEHRLVYSFSRVFDASTPGEEPRRFHLGTDIWGKPHSKVIAPLDGIIHSFAFNDSKGDYGATIILSHILENISFFTLYGHLSLNSIKNLNEGDRIHAGEVFAEFGIPAENGQWPPHLHFQLIRDIDGWKGDYPGVCRASEKDEWLSNCPDPDLVLNLNQYLL
jgi:peptidoglycan LD-endopeptidase LytH